MSLTRFISRSQSLLNAPNFRDSFVTLSGYGFAHIHFSKANSSSSGVARSLFHRAVGSVEALPGIGFVLGTVDWLVAAYPPVSSQSVKQNMLRADLKVRRGVWDLSAISAYTKKNLQATVIFSTFMLGAQVLLGFSAPWLSALVLNSATIAGFSAVLLGTLGVAITGVAKRKWNSAAASSILWGSLLTVGALSAANSLAVGYSSYYLSQYLQRRLFS